MLSAEDLPILQFSLSLNDLNQLKSIDQLASSLNNTFLFFSSDLTKDMNENPVNFSVPLSPTQIGIDLTPPRLSSFLELDFNKRVINLIFTEPVDIVTVNFSKIQLQVYLYIVYIVYIHSLDESIRPLPNIHVLIVPFIN